jgi:hypothetical protein
MNESRKHEKEHKQKKRFNPETSAEATGLTGQGKTRKKDDLNFVLSKFRVFVVKNIRFSHRSCRNQTTGLYQKTNPT